MTSKAVVFTCLLFVFTVVIVSAMSQGTQEQQHETVEVNAVENENLVGESKQQRCRYRCCQYDPRTRRCIRCCPRPAGVQATTQNQNVESGNPVEESKQRCPHGCCRFHGHRCVRCCRAVEVESTIQNQNENAVEENEVETDGFIGKGKGGKN